MTNKYLSFISDEHLLSCIENLHNSYVDVLVCARCYMKMEYNNDILETSKTFNMEWNEATNM